MPSVRDSGSIPLILTLSGESVVQYGVPEETRHGIGFGLLVAEVDDPSSWKTLGFEKKHAHDCLPHPSETCSEV
jgi:hypothetical protein